MARGWRVIDATSFEGVIAGSRGRIVLSGESQSEELPAEEIAVILIGSGASVTAAALHYLSKHDIVVLAADWRGVPFAGLYSWGDHGRVAARHLAQAELSVPRRKNAWMQLVRAKILAQAAVLAEVDDLGSEHLRSVARHVRSGDPANAEGTAARFYWSRLFSGLSFRRDQDAEDPLNSMLNYGYMVLRAYGVRAVVSAGLSPPLGLFHRGRGNYFNLVDDLIEPFRAVIDAAVLDLGPEATLNDRVVKRALVEAASAPYTAEGYRVPAVLEDLAQQLGRYVEGDVDKLAPPRWRGPEKELVPSLMADSGGEPPW